MSRHRSKRWTERTKKIRQSYEQWQMNGKVRGKWEVNRSSALDNNGMGVKKANKAMV